MTIAEIAAQMGVAPETLVQEVISKQTAWHTFCTAVVALMLAIAIGFIVWMLREKEFDLAVLSAVVVMFGAFIALIEVEELSSWLAAPETTAREYIMENYGGNAKWN